MQRCAGLFCPSTARSSAFGTTLLTFASCYNIDLGEPETISQFLFFTCSLSTAYIQEVFLGNVIVHRPQAVKSNIRPWSTLPLNYAENI